MMNPNDMGDHETDDRLDGNFVRTSMLQRDYMGCMRVEKAFKIGDH